jgi:hypothetical protein
MSDKPVDVVLTIGPQGLQFVTLDGEFHSLLDPADLTEDLWEQVNQLVTHLYETLGDLHEEMCQSDKLWWTEPSRN